jgi:hypothetical protein
VSTLRWGPGMAGFAAEAVVEMVPQAGWRRVRVDAVRPGAGPTGANLRTVREGWLYFPPAVETLDCKRHTRPRMMPLASYTR